MRSVLLVEETDVPGENHRPDANHRQNLSHNVDRVQLAKNGFEFTTLVVIGTDCTGICKSNYHTITKRRPLLSNGSRVNTEVFYIDVNQKRVVITPCLLSMALLMN